MKIVYCTGRITTSGGIERVLSIKTKYLVEKGYDVSIILVDKTTDEKPFFEFDSRIKFYCLENESNDRGLKKRLKSGKNKKILLNRLNILLNEIKPDITISIFGNFLKNIHQTNDGSIKITERHFAKYKSSQYFASFDKYMFGRWITYLYRIKDYLAIRKFDAFVVLTEEDKGYWGNLGNIHYIPNPLTFIPEKISNAESKRIIALGRTCKQKQIDLLIKIWSRIVEKHPEWKLVTFGNGNIDELKKLAAKLNISDNVEINPPTSDVEKELSDSSIYALTSKYEGFGMVLTEAMSVGLPVVSFACKCGPRDIINDGEDGFLVEPGDIDTFAERLSLLIDNEELRKKMSAAAATNILRYSEDMVMEKWEHLFNSLVESK